MVRKILILIACFNIGGLVTATAQESQLSQAKQDSILNAKQDSIMNTRIKSDGKYQVKVNALEYSMQKRYRPEYKKFANKRFADNLYIGLWGGLNGLFSRASYEMSGGSEVGISATKFFSPYNAVRLSGVMNNGKRKLDNESWSSYGLLGDHLFNITTYADGFNPGRLLELSTVEGIGVHRSSLGGEKATALDVHMGLQLKMHTGTRLDFFFEPRVSLFTDNIDLSGDENWHGYDVGYSAYLGMNYRLGSSYRVDDFEEPFMENTFVSISQGVQVQNSALAREVGLLKAIGPSVSVSVGKWLLDYFGLRLSAFGAYDSWKLDHKRNMDKLAAYGGGRLEAMVNPYAFFSKDVRSVKWGVIPMIGVEAGMMKKQDNEEMISKTYAALTAGVQFKYYVDKNFALFLEPRFSSVPYSFTEKNFIGKVEETSFSDALWSLSMGVEVRRPEKQERDNLRALKAGFKPYNYTSLGLGLAYPMQTQRYHNRRAGYSLTVALGRQITPVSGFRIGADVSNLYSWNAASSAWLPRNYLTGTLAYTLDVTNFVAGYDPDRKWNAELFGGPVLTIANGTGKKIHPGIEGGGRLGLSLYDNFGIYAEPKFRLYTKRILSNGLAGATPLQMNLSLGTTYRFGSSYRSAAASRGFGDGTIWGNTFISLSEGLQNTAGNLKGGGAGRVRAAGPAINVAVGKWLVDFFGLRISAFASSNSYARIDAKSGRNALAAYGGGRIEGMLNPVAFFTRDGEMPRWGIVPMAGLELGMLAKQQPTGAFKKKYAALTGGVQLKYYVTDHMAIFVEPHATRIPYSVTKKEKGVMQTSMVADNLLSFSVGVELSRLAGLTMSKLGLDKVSFDPYNFASVAIGAGVPVSAERYSTQKLGAMLGLSAGRQFSPYSAVRANAEYMSVSTKYGTDRTFSYASLALDYMLGISNIMAGYNENRSFGTDIFAGPVCSFGLNGGGTHLGFEAGARVYYKMQNGFDLYAEPKFRAYAGNFMNYKSYSGTPFMMSFSVGTSYRF